MAPYRRTLSANPSLKAGYSNGPKPYPQRPSGIAIVPDLVDQVDGSSHEQQGNPKEELQWVLAEPTTPSGSFRQEWVPYFGVLIKRILLS